MNNKKSREGGNIMTKSRVAYILFAIFLGGLGIHNFYAGYTGKALAQLLITIFTWWLIFPVFAIAIWAIIEACVVKVDAEGNEMVN